MSRVESAAEPNRVEPGTPVRTALISTRRLAILFPGPELNSAGYPSATRLDRLAAALRRRIRLVATRLHFAAYRLGPAHQALVHARLRVRLALVRMRLGLARWVGPRGATHQSR